MFWLDWYHDYQIIFILLQVIMDHVCSAGPDLSLAQGKARYGL